VIKAATKEVVVATAHSTIPSDGSVTTIANYAFRGQTELKSFTVPHGITTIRSDAFFDCTNLSSFHLSDTVTKLSPNFKNNFKSITTLTVDENNPVYHSSGNCIIETASKTLVRGCSTSTIPADGSVTSIGYSAFYYSRDLTDLIIPSAVSQIGSDCLRNCKDLKSVTILNPDAQIDGGANTLYGDVTIHGYAGSTAEAYAQKYSKTFAALNPHICTYDQKVTADKYLSSAASCTAPASYFYACTCGEKGTKTFSHGEALPHTYNDVCDASCNVCDALRTTPHAYTEDWKSVAIVHWHECSCGAKADAAAHAWDDGTVVDAEKVYACTTCGAQRVENIVTPPEITEPTLPSIPEPTTSVQTEPSTTTEPSEPATPEQDSPSLILILPVALSILVLLILIVFLLKRKKQAKGA
jgi:hypothetical protein